MKTEFYECQCYSDEHILRFFLDKKDGWLCVSTFLSQPNSFFQRIWLAIKYVFGYKCKYGHFDCFIFRDEDADRLINLLQQLKDAKNESLKQKIDKI